MTDVYKMKTLLLENYKNMFSKMHGNTKEKSKIGKMIEELEVSLMDTDVYIEDFK
jgi:hypothetical protein